MKIIIILIFISISLIGNAQVHELDFNYRIGFAASSLKVLDPTFEDNIYENQYTYNYVKPQFDQGVTLLYKWKFFNEAKLFLTGGIEFSSSKYYQQLIDPNDRLLDNIRLSSNRFSFRLGLNKQFQFYHSKVILDIGCHIVNRYYFKTKSIYYTDFHFNNEDWIEYKYNLTTYYGKYYENNVGIENKRYMYLNLDFNINLMLELFKNTYLTFGVSYSRNNIFFYDYTYTINYYNNGSSIPTSTFSFEGLEGAFNPKFGVREHYLYFNFGMSYKFGKKSI